MLGGGEAPRLQPEPVARFGRLERPVHRQRRRQQDRRVDERDELRQLGPVRRPGGPSNDPDEEVGREEGPEDHHLADDEKQHAEQLRVHPRRAVGGWRVSGVNRVLGGAGCFHHALTGVASMCSTGRLVAACTRSTSFDAIQRELPSGSVEITISEMWKNCTAFIVAVYGSGSPTMPAATIPSSRSDATSARMRSRASATAWPSRCSCGTTTMNRWGPVAASSGSRALSSGAVAVRFATTRVTSNGRPSATMATTTCSTGRAG